MAASGFSAADVERWIPRLRRYALALTGQRDVADDLVQDTLERAWRKRALWQPGTDLRAWLFTVMHNVHINRVRASRPVEPLEDYVDDGRASVGASSSASVESGVMLSELKRALMKISDEQREVVLLVGLEQMSYAEAAAVIEVPVGTVMSRLARGRERLRGLLSDGGQPASGTSLRRVK